MTDIHSCSYHCDRPDCIKSQRDELRDEITDLRNELAEYTQAADKLAAENKVLRDELARLRAQEPVAWMGDGSFISDATKKANYSSLGWADKYYPTPLYAAPPAQPATEPCCGEYASCGKTCVPRGKWLGRREAENERAEPQRLTDEQINAIWNTNTLDRAVHRKFARAIEAAIIGKAAP